jgi:uncharacterized protein
VTFLLDVNVLIALLDPAHVGHDLAHDWFAREGAASWATCPITENGTAHIIAHPKYPNSCGSPAAAAPLVAGLRAAPGHEFWADDISLFGSPLVDAERIPSHAQVTDTYLLALAAARGGKLATLDKKLSAAAVKNGNAALHLISA